MDPVTGTVVAGLVAVALEKVIEHATEDVLDASQTAVGRLIAWVRRKFQGRPELAALEDAPDSARRTAALGDIIEAELVADPASREEAGALVAGVKTEQPDVYQSVVNSRYVIQANASTVTIHGGFGTVNRSGHA